ncbi:SAM-dependent methyltransferase [Actinacidiphila soli]|uniref:SAM-dependent methyltransferase n=1 Tax=Actinacidiphila soli TaxID=2487275 RepID=UPI000FCA7386|nr:SAM-dependent methyltransferase [Actinacidiphila soli]
MPPYQQRGFTFVLRSRDEILRFLTDSGPEVVEPGIVPAHHWRPDHASDNGDGEAVNQDILDSLEPIDKVRHLDINDVTDDDINAYGTVAYKP